MARDAPIRRACVRHALAAVVLWPEEALGGQLDALLRAGVGDSDGEVRASARMALLALCGKVPGRGNAIRNALDAPTARAVQADVARAPEAFAAIEAEAAATVSGGV